MNTNLITITFLAIAGLSSCTKAYDYLNTHPIPCCRIDSVTVNLQIPATNTQRFHFSYDGAGRPTLIAAQVPNALNYQDYIFRYDKYGRLKDYIFTDGGGGTYAYIWDRYTYPAAHTIIDTTYEYQGNVTSPNTNPGNPNDFTYIRTITQDALGRTIRVIFSSSSYNDTSYTRYDTQGDAIISGVSYDDKINWYQLSPTWQLVFNDYSTHNPFIPASLEFPASITSYDGYGLPTGFQERSAPPGQFGARLMVFDYTTMQVSYSCDRTAIAITNSPSSTH